MWHMMTHDMTWHETDDKDFLMTWQCQAILVAPLSSTTDVKLFIFMRDMLYSSYPPSKGM